MSGTRTTHYKVIFPKDLNNNDTLFGGLAMQWMDEVAYITATRVTRKKMVTVSVSKVNFAAPILPNSIVEVSGVVQSISSAQMEVYVEIYQEDMYSEKRTKAVDALFILAAVGKE